MLADLLLDLLPRVFKAIWRLPSYSPAILFGRMIPASLISLTFDRLADPLAVGASSSTPSFRSSPCDVCDDLLSEGSSSDVRLQSASSCTTLDFGKDTLKSQAIYKVGR